MAPIEAGLVPGLVTENDLVANTTIKRPLTMVLPYIPNTTSAVVAVTESMIILT